MKAEKDDTTVRLWGFGFYKMNKGNKIVQSLWIGSQLGTMEHLSITSFLRQGHDFHLYTYGPVGNVPEGCVIKDANKILSQKDWNYKEFPRLALFADFFRYKLLLEKGGWWVDTDTICMRPFTFPQEYVFSSEAQRDGGIHINNGNIKAPVGSPIIQQWSSVS